MRDDRFMRGSHASQIIWHQVQAVAGQGTSSIEMAAFVGQVLYKSGERGTWIGIETVGTVDNPDIFSGNAIVLLEDGSVANETFEGKTERKDGPDRFAGTGTWRMQGGTGRFAGLHGSGQFRWSLDGDRYEDEFSA
jgi:hypothetical protein